MKIYTKTGDDGSTGLYGGERVAKCNPRIEAFGMVDELNALLGIVRLSSFSPSQDAILNQIQNRLFDLGAELATPDAAAKGTDLLQEADVAQLETWIDEFELQLPELKNFILPGGSPAAAWFHLARCVCRRMERQLVSLSQETAVRETVLHYVNRLGDLLFVLARSANAAADMADVPWQKTR